MIETRNGETYNGTLRGVDRFTNIKLEDAVLTSKDGTRFHKVKEVFVRGNCLKYVRIDEEVLQNLEGTQYVIPKWMGADKERKKAGRKAFHSLETKKN